MGSFRENAFSQDDVTFLTQFARQVAIAVDNAIAYGQISALKDQLAQEKLYLEDEIRSELNFEEIVGKSGALRHVLTLVETVAPTDSTVLIYGETGTGKELIARAVHNHCSGTKKARSRAPSRNASDGLSWRTAELFFWTKSGRFRSNCSRSFFASCRSASSNGWGARARFARTRG